MDLHGWDGMGQDELLLVFFREKPRGCLFSTELWCHIMAMGRRVFYRSSLVIGETGPFGGALNSWEAAGGGLFARNKWHGADEENPYRLYGYLLGSFVFSKTKWCPDDEDESGCDDPPGQDWAVIISGITTVYGCFLKWWYPQNTPKWSFLVGKPMVVGYHHFRNPPYTQMFPGPTSGLQPELWHAAQPVPWDNCPAELTWKTRLLALKSKEMTYWHVAERQVWSMYSINSIYFL